MYSKILKELKKGNAILLEVRWKHAVGTSVARYRLITPNSCEFAHATVAVFTKSCFMDEPINSPTPIQVLMKRMFVYDRVNGLHINKMQVLK